MKEKEEPFFEGPSSERGSWMLGIFDVLGFSNLVKDKGVESVYSVYKELIDRVIQKEGVRCLGTTRLPGSSDRYAAAFFCETRVTYFSDTILLWLPLHPLFPGPFLQRCADLICEALKMGIPLRGAISLGDGYMHRQSGIFLGDMISEAHRLEAAQDWIGCALAHSATWSQFLAEVAPSQIIEFTIPVKPEKVHLDLASPIALDWPRRWRDTEESSLQDVLSRLSPSGEFAKYYDNAIAFADWSERHHEWHKRSEAPEGFNHMRRESEETEQDVHGNTH